jgi:hypothetical protein
MKTTIEEDVGFAEVRNHEDKTATLKLDVYSPSGGIETKRPAILRIQGADHTPVDHMDEIIDAISGFLFGILKER